MTTRPGYVWDDVNEEWVKIGQAAVVAPVSYQATAPTSPATGDIWIDSDDDVPSIDSSVFYRWKKTAVGGETTLSGSDDASLLLKYTVGYEELYINGVLQVRGSDYVATTGTTITGLIPLVAGDIVTIMSQAAYALADTYTQSVADSKFALKNGPAFSAWASSSTSIAVAPAAGKIGFQTKVFDTNNNFDTSLSRFTPTVPGYYQINCLITLAVATAGNFTPFIYKNGVDHLWGATVFASSTNFPRSNISALVFANGTTDYFEIFAGHGFASATVTHAAQNQTFFQASYVRGP
jgi:hypothetical protein